MVKEKIDAEQIGAKLGGIDVPCAKGAGERPFYAVIVIQSYF
jgi:hypothetical protein